MLWLTLLVQQTSEQSGLSQLWGPLLGAAGMILVGLITQFGTLRTSTRSGQIQRDAQLDQRADAQYTQAQEEIRRLRAQVVEVEGQRDEAKRHCDDYRERLVRLRLEMMGAGLDPDNIKNKEG